MGMWAASRESNLAIRPKSLGLDINNYYVFGCRLPHIRPQEVEIPVSAHLYIPNDIFPQLESHR
jgi:hypothetical protein